VTQVAELTAQLGLEGLQQTLAGLKEVDRQVNVLREDLRGLTRDAEIAKAALDGFGISDTAIAKQAALNDEMRKTRDLALEIRAASGGGGGLGGGGGSSGFVGLFGGGGGATSAVGRDAEAQFRRDISTGGLLAGMVGVQEAKRITQSGAVGDAALIPAGDLRGEANRLEQGAVRDALRTRIAARAASGGGSGSGVDRGALFGLLPGGARPSQAALTTLLGLAVGGAPAVAPGLLAAAPIAGAGIGALAGAAGTLKLAFDGITSAAFTTQAAFDKLTPAQQAFVQTLRGLDAGLGATLKGIAQGTLLPQLSSALHTAFSPSAVSSLSGGVGAFSNAIGGGAQDFAKLFGSSGFQDQFGQMLQQDAGYLKTFLDAFTTWTDAIVRFQVSAAPLLTWLGGLTTQLADWVDTSIQADQANGRLANFFDILKTSLQTTGTLLLSIGHLAGGFVDALGFQNSVALVNLLSRTLNDLADFLKANGHVFQDFFKGALDSANDLLSVIRGLGAVITPVLSLFDKLIGGSKGWQLAIDALAVTVVAKFLLMDVAVSTYASILEAIPWVAASTAGVIAIEQLIEHWQQFKGWLQDFSNWVNSHLTLLLLNPLTAWIAITVEVVRHWGLIKDAIQDVATFLGNVFGPVVQTVEGLFNALQAAIINSLESVLQAFQWVVDKIPSSVLGISTGAGAVKSALAGGISTLQGLASGGALVASPAETVPHFQGTFAGAAGGSAPPAAQINLNLPGNIQLALAKAANPGSTAAADALAFAFYQNQLALPNLTQAQQISLYTAEGPYRPSSASGTAGALTPTAGTGYQVPIATQTAISNAVTAAALKKPGALKQETSAYQNAIKVVQGQLGGLSPTDRITAQTDIQGFVSALAGLAPNAGVAFSGLNVLPQGIRSRLVAQQTRVAGIGSVGATTPFSSDTIRALKGLDVQQQASLESIKKQLDSQALTEKQVNALKAEQLQLTKEQAATEKQITDQVTMQKQAAVNLRQEQILGIGGGAGQVSAARETATVRTFLNATLKQFGLGGTGSGELGPFVQELKKNGDINQKQYTSLEKILSVITLAKESGDKLTSAITGNVSQRLAEIKQELQSSLGFSDLNSVTTEQSLLRHAGVSLTGTRAQRARFLEQSNEALQNRGLLAHAAGSANGVPLIIHGAPALSTHHTIEITVKDAAGRVGGGAKQIADEVYKIFQKNYRRNTTLMTGANAGRNLGAGLG
jgi:hypothetical protein